MLFLNARGEVCEGTITNVFLRADGGLLTPPLRLRAAAGRAAREPARERTGARGGADAGRPAARRGAGRQFAARAAAGGAGLIASASALTALRVGGVYRARDRSPGRPTMHAYRTHTCAALTAAERRRDRPPVGLGAPGARPWRRAVRRPARPLRHHPGAGRQRQPGLRRAREGARRMGDPHRRRGEGARRRAGQPEDPDRRDRGLRDRASRCCRRPRSCRCRCSARSTIPRRRG